MTRYLTTYNLESDRIEAFTESDDYNTAIDNAQEWVWQFADSKEQAVLQHTKRHDEWMANPDRVTYGQEPK